MTKEIKGTLPWVKSKLDEKGHEIMDPTPVELPIAWQRSGNLTKTIQELIRVEMSRAAEREGQETFEEADDFNVDEDFDPTSPWELDYDQEERNLADFERSILKEQPEAPKQPEAVKSLPGSPQGEPGSKDLKST